MKDFQYVTTLNCQKAEDIKQEIRKMTGRIDDHDKELIEIEKDVYEKWRMESERITAQNIRLYDFHRRLKWMMAAVAGAYIWSVLWFISR